MIELEKEFIFGGSGYAQSPRHFKQIKRNRLFAIYERSTSEGEIDCYEVIKINIIKAGTKIPQFNKIYTEDQETYPGSKSFGKSGWACADLKRAEEKFNELTKDFGVTE